jgi:hypothetical protein
MDNKNEHKVTWTYRIRKRLTCVVQNEFSKMQRSNTEALRMLSSPTPPLNRELQFTNFESIALRTPRPTTWRHPAYDAKLLVNVQEMSVILESKWTLMAPACSHSLTE